MYKHIEHELKTKSSMTRAKTIKIYIIYSDIKLSKDLPLALS